MTDLRKLAESAGISDHNENPSWYDVDGLLLDGVYYPKNARFIAACSPDVILQLLDRLDRQDKLLRDLSKAIKGDRHDVEDWPEDSRNAIAAIEKELKA